MEDREELEKRLKTLKECEDEINWISKDQECNVFLKVECEVNLIHGSNKCRQEWCEDGIIRSKHKNSLKHTSYNENGFT